MFQYCVSTGQDYSNTSNVTPHPVPPGRLCDEMTTTSGPTHSRMNEISSDESLSEVVVSDIEDADPEYFAAAFELDWTALDDLDGTMPWRMTTTASTASGTSWLPSF
jgi:hypothetical protein